MRLWVSLLLLLLMLNSVLAVNGNESPQQICGDNVCDQEETCESCPQDCGECPAENECGNELCEDGEDEFNCPEDCCSSSDCNNNICSPCDSYYECYDDCEETSECGNGVCEDGEDENNCPQDCEWYEEESITLSVSISPDELSYNDELRINTRTNIQANCDFEIISNYGPRFIGSRDCIEGFNILVQDLVNTGVIDYEGEYIVRVYANSGEGHGQGEASFNYKAPGSSGLNLKLECSHEDCTFMKGQNFELIARLTDNDNNPISGAFVRGWPMKSQTEEINCPPNKPCISKMHYHGDMWFNEEKPGYYKHHGFIDINLMEGRQLIQVVAEMNNFKVEESITITIKKPERDYIMKLEMPTTEFYQDSGFFMHGQVFDQNNWEVIFLDDIKVSIVNPNGEESNIHPMIRGDHFVIEELIPFNAVPGEYELTITAEVEGEEIIEKRTFTIKELLRFYVRGWTEGFDYVEDEEITIYAEVMDYNGNPIRDAEVIGRVMGMELKKYEGMVYSKAMVMEDKSRSNPEVRVETTTHTGSSGQVVVNKVHHEEDSYREDGTPFIARINNIEPQRIQSIEMPSTSIMQNSIGLVREEQKRNNIKFKWDSNLKLYVAEFTPKRSGDYDVEIEAMKQDRSEFFHTHFFVRSADQELSEGRKLEAEAVKLAVEGDYDGCADKYLQAALEWGAGQAREGLFGRVQTGSIQEREDNLQRLFLDLEKGAMCNQLGSAGDDYYLEAAEILTNTNVPEKEMSVITNGMSGMLLYVGGAYGRGGEALRNSSQILLNYLEMIDNEEDQIFIRMMLAKFLEVGGQKSRAAEEYAFVCNSVVQELRNNYERYGGRIDPMMLVMAASMCEKGGELELTKKIYEEILYSLPETNDGSHEAGMTDYFKGLIYEKTGDAEKAEYYYNKSISSLQLSYRITGMEEGDMNLPISFPGKMITALMLANAQEFIGDSQGAGITLQEAMQYLETRPKSGSNLYVAMLAYTLGQTNKARNSCSEAFLDMLRMREDEFGKLLASTPICYEILGNREKADASCSMYEIIPDEEMMSSGFFMGLMPQPISYCSQRGATLAFEINRTAIRQTCGNGIADAGETPWTCCQDTGCPSGGYTCSATMNKCVRNEKDIDPLEILEAVIRIENLKERLEKLKESAERITASSSGERSEAWSNLVIVLDEITEKLDDLKTKFQELSREEQLSFEMLEEARMKFQEIKEMLNDAVRDVIEVM